MGTTIAVLGLVLTLSASASASARPLAGSVTDPEDIAVEYPFGSATGDPVGWVSDVKSLSASYDPAAGSLVLQFELHHEIRAYLDASFHVTLGRLQHGVCRTNGQAVELVVQYQGDAPVAPTLRLDGHRGPFAVDATLGLASGTLRFEAQDRGLRHRQLDCVTDAYVDDLGYRDTVAPFSLGPPA